MSLSYDGGLLGHLAEHMLYLSTTPSFWYSLNSSYDHGFHLSHRLGMTPHDYERLLAAANLAHYHPKWGFTNMVDRWKMFIEGHHFYTYNSTGSFKVKIDAKKLNFDALLLGMSAKHRRRVHVIRIGVSTDLSPKKLRNRLVGMLGDYLHPPTFEWTGNKNTIISKKSGSIYLEFYCREQYG